MSALKLYELPGQWNLLQAEIADADGEISSEVEQRLDAVETSLENKTEYIVCIMRRIELEADMAAKEAQRLQELAAVRYRNYERLKNYLHATLTAMGRDKVTTTRCAVTVCRNGRPSIQWQKEILDCPADYLKFTPSVDTQKAYEQWKAGDTLPPGFAVHQGTHIRIK